MLADAKRQYPRIKSRIILLTDGCDTASTIKPSEMCSSLSTNDIVLDTVVIGSNSTADLFKIAQSTCGYAFKPQTQQALFQIFLLETVVDIRTRPDITKVTCSDWFTFQPKLPEIAYQYGFPPCRPHPNVDDYFVPLGDFKRFANRISRRSPRTAPSISAQSNSTSSRLSVASTTSSSVRGDSRIVSSEIKAMIDNPHDSIGVYVSQSNMFFWKVIIQGPPDSPYANGTFLLYIEDGC